MAFGVFGLNKVSKKQVQNVTDNNFESWPELTEPNDFGYLMGGNVETASPPFSYEVSNTQRIDYTNSTLSSPPLRTPVPMTWTSGASNKLYGYFAGGFTPPSTSYSTITRLDFSTESKSNPGNNFSTGIYLHTSATTDFDAYFNKGWGPPSGVSKLNYSNETLSYPGNNIDSDVGQKCSTSSSYYGYFAGGSSLSTISRLDFSNEVVSNPGNNLLSNRAIGSVTSSLSYGYAYFAGGESVPSPPTYNTDIDKFDFSTETLTDLGINLPGSGTGQMGYSSSKNYGYYFGGIQNPGALSVSYIRKLDFSTETFVPQSNISGNRSNITLLSGNATQRWRNFKGFKTYGYIAPTAPVGNTSYIRLDLSTESSQLLNASNTSTASARGTVSNNYYGYFAGGFTPAPATISTINRFDFSNETETNPGNTLLGIGYFVSTNVMNNNYGYFCGGQFPPTQERSDVTRMDFSTEVVADTGKDLPFKGSYKQNFSAGSYGYFMGGYFYDPPGDDWFTTLSRLDFISETVSVIGTIGPTTCDGRAAVQNNLNGYVCGGGFPYINTVYKMEFSTENVSTPGNNLPTSASSSAALSSDYYGYIVGGSTPTISSNIQRLDFSSEIVSDNLNNIPISISGHYGVTN
jgi:hypothetical protein